LLRHGNIAVDELAEELGASAASVRRDLTRLEQRGWCIVLTAAPSLPDRRSTSLPL